MPTEKAPKALSRRKRRQMQREGEIGLLVLGLKPKCLFQFGLILTESNRTEVNFIEKKLINFDFPNRNRNRIEMHKIFSSVRFDSYVSSVSRF